MLSHDSHPATLKALHYIGQVLHPRLALNVSLTQCPVLYQRRGKSMLKQHQIVNTILAEELKQWHGLNLTTKAP